MTAGVGPGIVLAVFAIVFAILGLTPSLSWIPEIPLLIIAGSVPIALLLATGYRAWKSFRITQMAATAGAAAGGIGGCAGGVAYVVYGKPALNGVVGTIVGIAAGVALGTVGAWVAARRA
ncbi:MAG: hypothetical protein M3Q90_05380 [Candidatus Dormibacteraeota bacterium]|nr:hypothetical protein [Candidatus Dormibacteraeota bacterium]